MAETGTAKEQAHISEVLNLAHNLVNSIRGLDLAWTKFSEDQESETVGAPSSSLALPTSDRLDILQASLLYSNSVIIGLTEKILSRI